MSEDTTGSAPKATWRNCKSLCLETTMKDFYSYVSKWKHKEMLQMSTILGKEWAKSFVTSGAIGSINPGLANQIHLLEGSILLP